MMKTSRVLTFFGAAMLLALVGQPVFAQSEGDPEVAPIIDKGAMKPVKNSVEARINRMTQKLDLTAEQQAAIKQILEDEAILLKAIITDANQNSSEHKSKLQELREATSSKIRSVLTPEQQQRQEEFRKELIERRKQKDIKQLR